MVMEEPPSPQCVGREFVRQYYTLLNKAPHHLHRFYNSASSFVHGGLDAPDRETVPVIGQTEIHKRIQQLNFLDCHAKISQVDSQATLGNGVVVQVTGELSNGGQPMRRFTQTFVLAAQSPKNFYVHNDIFRYQDFVFSDEDGEWEYSRTEETPAPQPQSSNLPTPYFPTPPTAPVSNTSQPPQQVQQAAPVQTVTVQPQHVHVQQPPRQEHVTLNGHQEQDVQGNMSLNANDSGDINQEYEVEDTVKVNVSSVTQSASVTQPAHEPAPVISSEPKTYANLVKSGSYNQTAQQTPQATTRVTSSAPRTETTPNTSPATPTSAPQHQRPRNVRAPRSESNSDSGGNSGNAMNNTPVSSSTGRRYSDSHQLFLGNVPHNATKEELRGIFEKFGTIADLRVYSKPPGPPGSTQNSNRVFPNYAFLTYEDAQSAQNCLNHGALFYPSEDSPDAQQLNVQEKKSRMTGGNRGGGGGGGGSGNRGGARPPRPAFSRPPYQPQRR